jgi:hypothetical protein
MYSLMVYSPNIQHISSLLSSTYFRSLSYSSESPKEYKQDPNQAFPGQGHLKPTDQEMDRLGKQVSQLQMENDILKKAMAIFTNPKK